MNKSIFCLFACFVGSFVYGADDPMINLRVSNFARANIGNQINAGTGQDFVITALMKCGASTTNLRPITANEVRNGDIIDFRTCSASRGNVTYFSVPYQQWAAVEVRQGNDIVVEVQGYNGVPRVMRGVVRLSELNGQVNFYRPQTR